MDPTVALRWFARLEEEIQDFMESPKKVDTTSAPLVAAGAPAAAMKLTRKHDTNHKAKLGLLQAGIYAMLQVRAVQKKKSIEEAKNCPLRNHICFLVVVRVESRLFCIDFQR